VPPKIFYRGEALSPLSFVTSANLQLGSFYSQPAMYTCAQQIRAALWLLACMEAYSCPN
jgi:hypothetical protein